MKNFDFSSKPLPKRILLAVESIWRRKPQRFLEKTNYNYRSHEIYLQAFIGFDRIFAT